VRILPVCAGLLIGTIALGSPVAAQAQGNGRPKTNRTVTTTPTGAGSTSLSGTPTSYPQFGAWIDDASAPTPGVGAVSIGVGHWRLAGMTQTNVPMIGAGIGITDRLQASASVPFYRVSAATWSASGVDDMYLSAKYTLLDPTLTISEVGLAISPVVEILGADTGDGRVHFAIPVNVELRRLPFRIYGSAGYFTRGAMFGGAAVEWSASNGFSLTGSLMQSYSMKAPDPALGTIGRQHADVSVGAAMPIGQTASVYGSVGRSLTSIDAGGTSLAVTAGVALRFSALSSTP
jgi:hypothetical protein